MRQFLLTTTLICLSGFALAQENDNDTSGFSLMERGARNFFDGMKKEMAPALDGLSDWGRKASPALRNFVSEMGPALTDLLDEVEDWSVYEPPQKMPNGDIVIRRKPEPEDETPNDAPAPPAIYLDEVPQFDL
ncbi:MAG: hypothetical protein V7666_11270 [Sulfitobacter sp.]|uniref:hypothetical protein n=1 Tax=Sulfitobacter sp. TaxID=1903071 RepID=UPI003002DDBD